MKKITIYFVLALLCLNFKVKAQENKAIDLTAKGIQIGQKVPDITITGLQNYKDASGNPASTAKLSDFKGKLLILDFWATWCSPCIAMIPKMDSLQKAFGSRIQFLSVTYQTEKEVMPFLEKFEKQKGRHYDLPVVAASKELHQLFPHVYLPHYVWIDGEGMVRAITDNKEVSASNIEKAIKLPISFTQKRDTKMVYNNKMPLIFSFADTTNFKAIKQSALTSYVDGLNGGFYQNITLSSNEPYKRITVTNRSLPLLYQVAFMDGKTLYRWNRILLEVEDKEKIYVKKSGQAYLDWMKKGNGFCYELIIESGRAIEAWDLMKADLKAAFPAYDARIEKRLRPVLELIRTSTVDKLQSQHSEVVVNFNTTGGSLKNVNMNILVRELNDKGVGVFDKPIVNGTGYSGKIDIFIDANCRDIASLNAALAKYDLKLIGKEKEIEVLVISDKNKQTTALNPY